MARSPFSGTWQPNVRPTVVTAPDTIVFLNGEMEAQGCPACNRSFDFNKFITSVQVDLSIDSVPGSASLSLSVPRHTIDNFYFDGEPVITPMMEVEIYTKGYYLLEGLPQYYPIFWGIVTEVNDTYSGGEHTVSVHCADILKWWELCKMNINPAMLVPNGQQGRNIFGSVYYGTNPYDVIWSLCLQSFGDVLVGTGSLNSLIREKQDASTISSSLRDMMLYWEQRFSKIRSNLTLYGVNGNVVRGDTLYQTYSSVKRGGPAAASASAAMRNASGGKDGGQEVFDPTSDKVTAFKTQFMNAGQVDFWQSEYETKLELANRAKEAIGFEFYMDPSGDIVFKPPFYNLDILSNKPVSWIQDIDIIDWDLSESEAEVVTQLVMQGSYGDNVDYSMSQEITPFTSVTDYHLLRKYGWRSENYNSEFLGDPNLMFYHGLDLLDRKNSRRHRGTVTIPCRPELRLGFPIYLAPKDQIWYVTGISHNLQFGGRATTSLTLTAKRQKFIAPKGTATLEMTNYSGPSPDPTKTNPNAQLSFPYTSRLLSKHGSFKLTLGHAATLPPNPNDLKKATTASATTDNPYDPLILRHPKTGRLVGYPNVCMVYTRPFAPADVDFDATAGFKPPGTNPEVDPKKNAQIAATQQQEQTNEIQKFKVTDYDRVKDTYATNRYQYGLTSAGVYVYAHDTGGPGGGNPNGVIAEILTLPVKNLTLSPRDPPALEALRGKTALIRPVSDERGFEVIGHFRYGRRVALRDGQLILTGNVNTKASVDLQLALGGDLFATLTAQSEGLTAISTAYANPADAVTRLSPDPDLQTGGVINPDTKQISFTDTTPNFVDTAPLGSPAQQGTAGVEASQFSRALTLAEMTVKMPGTVEDPDCVCITGRSDLAFINTGYQVKTLSGAAPDVQLGGGAIPPNPTQTLSQVDKYLTTLYKALDGPHQQFEKEIRGDFLPGGQQTASGNSQFQTPEPSEFAPPFNPANTWNGTGPGSQDPLGAIESNATDLKSGWAKFGNALKNTAQRTMLQQQILNDKNDIQRFTSQLTALQQQAADSGSVFVGAPPISQQIADLKAKIARLQQEVLNDQQKLNTLPAQ